MITLVQPLIPALRRYARALLRDRDEADDLVQDALERAIANWRQRRRASSLRAWLFTILHNLAMDRLRRRARRGYPAPIEDVPEARLAIPPTQETAAAQRNIMALVARLPEEQRSVLLLIGVEELSYAEAARVLDVPQGTIMSRLSRARERLRRLMEEGEAASPPSLRIVP
ncbi:MAG TPA: sigma-70 family RNA polymerase sigma factor [Sphingomonas sp.]|nr:sigma-70 family RNA polymerase sigma factor [Sphingomonas sp.]